MNFPTHLFHRVTSRGQFLAELDGLRALAILPVVLFHATLSIYLKGAAEQVSITGSDVFRSPLGWIVSHGFLGVELFFVISGFVVTLPFARFFLLANGAKPSLKAFYLKRLTRIEPPYLIALVAFFVGVLVVAPENARVADYIAGMFYLRTAFFGDEAWAFFISWSLEIEVQFYLLAPFLASIFAVRKSALRRTLLVAAIALSSIYAAQVRCAHSEPAPLVGPLQHGSWLGAELSFFLIGLLCADFWVMREERTGVSTRSLRYDIAWLAGLTLIGGSYWLLERSAWGIAPRLLGLFAITMASFRARIVRRILSFGLITCIGGACYTIYLFHFLCVSLFGRLLAPLTSTSFEHNVLLVALPFALVVTLGCLCLFPFVERPFMSSEWPQLMARALSQRSPRLLGKLWDQPTSRTGLGS